jgi:hypothetical protein
MDRMAGGPTLTVSGDGGLQIFDRDALLARSDVVEITTSRDVAYRTPQTYRAVALAKLFVGVDVEHWFSNIAGPAIW